MQREAWARESSASPRRSSLEGATPTWRALAGAGRAGVPLRHLSLFERRSLRPKSSVCPSQGQSHPRALSTRVALHAPLPAGADGTKRCAEGLVANDAPQAKVTEPTKSAQPPELLSTATRSRSGWLSASFLVFFNRFINTLTVFAVKWSFRWFGSWGKLEFGVFSHMLYPNKFF